MRRAWSCGRIGQAKDGEFADEWETGKPLRRTLGILLSLELLGLGL